MELVDRYPVYQPEAWADSTSDAIKKGGICEQVGPIRMKLEHLPTRQRVGSLKVYAVTARTIPSTSFWKDRFRVRRNTGATGTTSEGV
jgi:hypothetical protein